MTLMKWLDAGAKCLNFMDIGLLKICVAAFTLMIAKLWPALLTPDWRIFGGIFLVTYVPLMIKLVIRRDGHA